MAGRNSGKANLASSTSSRVKSNRARHIGQARLKGMAALSRPLAWPWSSEQEEGGGQPMSEACWEEVTTVGAGTVS